MNWCDEMKLTEKKIKTPAAVGLADSTVGTAGASEACGEFSILNLHEEDFIGDDGGETEAFYQDLNLLPVIDKMTLARWKSVRKLFFYLPKSAEDTAYRRAVYADVKKEPVYRALLAFTEKAAAVQELIREKERTSNLLQRTVWKLREAGAYISAFEELAEVLSGAEPASDGMREFLRILMELLEDGGYRRMREETQRLLSEIRGIRFVVTYEKDRIRVEPVEDSAPGRLRTAEGAAEERRPAGEAASHEATCEEWLSLFDGGELAGMSNPFVTDSVLSEIESACLDLLKEKKPDFFRTLERAAEYETSYARPVLSRFEREIPFYLAFRGFQLEMEREGFAFATPAADGEAPMEAKGLYDIALALASYPEGRPVISNDFYYGEGERFFVLTGPNQGGKTTFARSLGQLVFFAAMGLDVPAKSANVPFFAKIRSHFSVEESAESGRGKLMEELVRLAPMMREEERGSFVIINELFTTAANYDAQIMGKRVLSHFLALDCRGIYVTHLAELAEENAGIVSLRAMLDAQGVPNFEIRRGSPEDTVCAAGTVGKYRLTYGQLKERL